MSSGCLFYGGDFDENNPNANALANENDAIVGGNPYGAATYQNFTNSQAWNITNMFTDNLSGLNPQTGYWEIRTGLSEDNGGTLVASGTAPLTRTLTGRIDFGFAEYRDQVNGLNLILAPGTYWMAVVPQNTNDANRSFNTNSFGLNAVGTQTSNDQFFNSSFFGANFTNANNEGVFPSPAAFWEPRCLSRQADHDRNRTDCGYGCSKPSPLYLVRKITWLINGWAGWQTCEGRCGSHNPQPHRSLIGFVDIGDGDQYQRNQEGQGHHLDRMQAKTGDVDEAHGADGDDATRSRTAQRILGSPPRAFMARRRRCSVRFRNSSIIW